MSKVTLALALLLGVLTRLLGPDAALAQGSATPDLRAMARDLPPELRQRADSYLVATDSAARARALWGLLQADRGGTDFAVAALAVESQAYVRSYVINYASAWPVPRAHEGFRQLLTKLLTTDPDSLVAQRAFVELQKIRAHDDFAAITQRVRATSERGAVPAWLQRLEQIASDNQWGIVLPRFMRQPPPVFAAVGGGANRPVRVLAFGDYGVGDDAQRKVAHAMRGYHAKRPFTMAITLGDNFYGFPRPESPESPRWRRDFEDLYGGMNIPIYVAVGNHDFDVPDQAAAEWVYGRQSKSWRLPALYYTYTAGYAQFFVLDGNELTGEQLDWLKRELDRSTARWKIVYGHYPLNVALPADRQSYLDHLNERAAKLLPIYAGRVDVQIAGHHHSLQHLKPRDGVHVLISGAAGRSGYPTDSKHPDALFASNQNGFMVLDVERDVIGVTIVGAEGQVLHEGKITK